MSKSLITAAMVLVSGALLTMAGTAAAQQPYPSKPIRFILPYAPGGNTSILARLIGQKLTDSWNQPVIVDNRPGGNTIIGTEALAKSSPDGYTILLVTSTHVIVNPQRPTPYDAIRDFAPVATLASSESILVLHPSLPVNTLREFIALARSKPGQLNFASPGSGGVGHLAGELFNMMTGVKMQHIAYKGGGPALADLIGGQVQLYFAVTISAIPHVKSGKLKAIAVSGETRLRALPQVPTFAEAGLPGFDAKTWFGVLAPAGTPKAIIDKLSAEIGKIVAMPDVHERLVGLGVEPFISSSGQFEALMKADMAAYDKIIRTANIKLEN